MDLTTPMPSNVPASRMKLVALDGEDLRIVSAHCQDAVLKANVLNYLPAERRFFVEMNRFIWEKPSANREPERLLKGADIDSRKRLFMSYGYSSST